MLYGLFTAPPGKGEVVVIDTGVSTFNNRGLLLETCVGVVESVIAIELVPATAGVPLMTPQVVWANSVRSS